MVSSDRDPLDAARADLGREAHGRHEAGLLEAWASITRRKGLLVFGLVAGVALSCLYYFATTPKYESEVRILVMQKDSRLPTQGEQQRDYDRPTMYDDLLATHMEIFGSPLVVGHAIEKHSLAFLPTLMNEKAADEEFDPIQYIIDELEVTKGGEGRAKDARVLCATFRGPAPEDCAFILRALVDSYQDFLAETFEGTSDAAIDLITKTKETLGNELNTKQSEYEQFRAEAPLLWKKGDETWNSHRERLIELDRLLAEKRLEYTEKKSRLETIEEELGSEEAKDFTDKERLALLSEEYVQRLTLMLLATREDASSEAFLSMQPVRTQAAEAEFGLLTRDLVLAEKRTEFGEDHPEVRKAREAMEKSEDFLKSKELPIEEEQRKMTTADLLDAHILSLKHDLSALQKSEKELEGFLLEEREEAKKLVGFELKDERLRNEIDLLTEFCGANIERLREINLIKDYGAYVTEVISPVKAASEPVAPVLYIVLAAGSVLGLVFGTGLAYVVDTTDKTFRGPDEIRDLMDLPIMADVPIFVAPKKTASVSVGSNGAPHLDPTLVAYHRPKSRQAEAIRGLRTALYFSTHGRSQKVIQVTSPNPKDGKTTLSANLAVSIAQSGRKVLLVDADLRHPKLHKVLGVDAKVGLSDVLAGEMELADAVLENGIENLWFLPAGIHTPNPSELLSSSRFEQFIEVVREQYDFVLIDSPPLLAVSDPAVMAPRVDGVVLMIRIEKNGRPEVLRAREMLASVGADVLGIAVNGLGRDPKYGYGYYGNGYSYGYGYRYGYGYGYGNGSGNGKRDSHYYLEEEEGASKS